MGLYPIDCPECKKPTMWFSGALDQRCSKCIVSSMMKPIDLNSVRNIRDANESMSEIVDILNNSTEDQLKALADQDRLDAAKQDPTITLGEKVDSKDIYLFINNPDSPRSIIGLHAVGYAGPYNYTFEALDGTRTDELSNFMVLEAWGNEYNEAFEMIGRGSFRLSTDDVEAVAKEYEEDGWIRFKGPNK